MLAAAEDMDTCSDKSAKGNKAYQKKDWKIPQVEPGFTKTSYYHWLTNILSYKAQR